MPENPSLIEPLEYRVMRALEAADRVALPGFPTGPTSDKWLKAFLPALRDEGLKIAPDIGSTCGAPCFPMSGGSYTCALEPGHGGDHASLWNRPSHEQPVTWDDDGNLRV